MLRTTVLPEDDGYNSRKPNWITRLPRKWYPDSWQKITGILFNCWGIEKEHSYPGSGFIKKETGLSLQTIFDALKAMEVLEILTIEHGNQEQSNRYYWNVENPFSVADWVKYLISKKDKLKASSGSLNYIKWRDNLLKRLEYPTQEIGVGTTQETGVDLLKSLDTKRKIEKKNEENKINTKASCENKILIEDRYNDYTGPVLITSSTLNNDAQPKDIQYEAIKTQIKHTNKLIQKGNDNQRELRINKLLQMIEKWKALGLPFINGEEKKTASLLQYKLQNLMKDHPKDLDWIYETALHHRIHGFRPENEICQSFSWLFNIKKDCDGKDIFNIQLLAGGKHFNWKTKADLGGDFDLGAFEANQARRRRESERTGIPLSQIR